MSYVTQNLAQTMLRSEHRYTCIKAAQRVHSACDQQLTFPCPENAQRALEAFDDLLGKCLLFSDPISVNGDTVDLRELAAILDPKN